MTETTDETLMLRAREGDREAFTTLYERYRDRVMRFATRVTGRESLGAEVLQETFLYLFRKAHAYEPRAKFTTYLFRIAYHISLNTGSRERRREGLPVEPEETGRTAEVEPDRAERSEEYARVRAALESLPDTHRAVVSLRILEGLPVEAVAEILAIPEGTVKSRLYHALRKLRETVGSTKDQGQMNRSGR